MERISRDRLNLEMAELVAKRSTCDRVAGGVGCVVAVDGRVVVTGYSGAPAGMPHCPGHLVNSPPCDRAVHAEAGAISFAARKGIALDGGLLYCTLSPCVACAKLIINAGIQHVYYRTTYRDTEGIALLWQASVPCEALT